MIYKLSLFGKAEAEGAGGPVVCSFCRHVFFPRGGGGAFICVSCIADFRKWKRDAAAIPYPANNPKDWSPDREDEYNKMVDRQLAASAPVQITRNTTGPVIQAVQPDIVRMLAARQCLRCPAMVYLVLNDNTGKPGPLVLPPPSIPPNIAIYERDGQTVYHVKKKNDTFDFNAHPLTYISHYTDCPAAAKFKR